MRLSAIFRRGSASSTACAGGFAVSRFRVFLNVFSMRYPRRSTSNTYSLTVLSCRRIRRLRGRKRGPCRQGIGRSRGGLTSKIVAVTDALGYLVKFVILPGQKHDLVGTPRVIEGLSFGALTADRAFDAGWLLKELEERGAEAVIPPKKNRRQIRDYDRDMYGQRHQIENFFAKIKEFRAIATRYDKTDTGFAAAIYPAAGSDRGKMTVHRP